MDVNPLLFDYFAGGFFSFEPATWLRYSLGAGPMIIWSFWETEPEASTTEEVIVQSDSGFGLGIYARAGIDLFIIDKIGLNAGVRLNETTLSIEKRRGKSMSKAGNTISAWLFAFKGSRL